MMNYYAHGTTFHTLSLLISQTRLGQVIHEQITFRLAKFMNTQSCSTTNYDINMRNMGYLMEERYDPPDVSEGNKTIRNDRNMFSINCSPETINWNDFNIKREFLMNPCPKNGITEFYIRRHKGLTNLLSPEYRVYLRSGHVFLMSSKRRPNKPTSNYLISMSYDQMKGSASILGKLRSNFLGSEYQIYDSGRNPKHVDPFFEENDQVQTRSEMGAILYGTHLLRSGEPRSMKVCINRVADENNATTKKWQPSHKDEKMIRCFKYRSASAMRNLHSFINKVHDGYEDREEILRSFQGRVTLTSVKNFQLVGENDGKLVMQFGRVDKDEFVMDVQWPLSPFQAFAIALSSCDNKIACGD